MISSEEDEDEVDDQIDFMNRSLNSNVPFNELQVKSKKFNPKRGMKAFNQIRHTGIFSFDHHLGS